MSLSMSLFILLSGMAFESGVASTGSAGFVILTWVVAFVLVACVGVFAFVLTKEVRESLAASYALLSPQAHELRLVLCD